MSKSAIIIGWEFKKEPVGLGLIIAVLIFLLTQYCSICNPIHQTAIGKPFGIPLAVYGIAFTIGLFLAYFRRPRIYSIGINVALIVSIALILAQVVILREYCTFCLICETIYIILWIIHNQSMIRLATVVIVLATVATYFGTNRPITDYSVSGLNGTHYISSTNAQIIDQTTFPGAKVYSWDGEAMYIEQGPKNIILVASWCDHCSDTLREISKEDWDKTLVIDIAIKPGQNIDAEKAVWEKIHGLRTDHIFFDLDSTIWVKTLPRVYEGD